MRYKLLFALFVISLLASVAMAVDKENKFCPIKEIEEKGDCMTVQNSEYAQLFGIPNYYYGIVVFFLMSYITYLFITHPRKYLRLIIHGGITIGAIIAFFFIYLQQFVIKSYCVYCLLIDISMILAFVAIFLERRKLKKWDLN